MKYKGMSSLKIAFAQNSIVTHIIPHYICTHTTHTTVPQQTEIQFSYSGMASSQSLHANMTDS